VESTWQDPVYVPVITQEHDGSSNHGHHYGARYPGGLVKDLSVDPQLRPRVLQPRCKQHDWHLSQDNAKVNPKTPLPIDGQTARDHICFFADLGSRAFANLKYACC
jgi:hypothetical protein